MHAASSHPHLILAIDTSCDDTSAAVTRDFEVWSNVIASQTELHKPYGGVFPTVAKQAHRENILPVIATSLKRAQVSWSDITAIAVTQGPGLAPALEVGIAAAKQLATEHGIPVIPVNHLEGHLLSPLAHPKHRQTRTQLSKKNRSTAKEETLMNHLPALGVIVSGGHTLFVLVTAPHQYRILGETLDDAAGECLDKIGRMLNLGYPAGPLVEEFAKNGNPHAIPFPLPMTTSGDYNLSFSGLKTFARNRLEQEKNPSIADWCASTQYSVFRHITHKLNKVLRELLHDGILLKELWLGGGVAANVALRSALRTTFKESYQSQAPVPTLKTPYNKRLCMDNAAMIGVAAGIKLAHLTTPGQVLPHSSEHSIELERKPRLRLGE